MREGQAPPVYNKDYAGRMHYIHFFFLKKIRLTTTIRTLHTITAG